MYFYITVYCKVKVRSYLLGHEIAEGSRNCSTLIINLSTVGKRFVCCQFY